LSSGFLQRTSADISEDYQVYLIAYLWWSA
jgi:hypothetical protein